MQRQWFTRLKHQMNHLIQHTHHTVDGFRAPTALDRTFREVRGDALLGQLREKLIVGFTLKPEADRFVSLDSI